MRAMKEEDIFSVEDLRIAAKLSKTVVEVLDANGVFKGMSMTNQLSFFWRFRHYGWGAPYLPPSAMLPPSDKGGFYFLCKNYRYSSVSS